MRLAQRLRMGGLMPSAPPPSGLPTLIITDHGRGDTGYSIATFDVANSSSGTITELAGLADIAGDRAKGVLYDRDRNIAFITGANADSMVYSLNLSDPSNPAGWYVGELEVYPSYGSSMGKMAYDDSKQYLYVSSRFDSFIICDVSDPANMTIVEQVATPDENIGDMLLDKSRQILYTTNRDTIWAFDVSDPHSVTQLIEYTYPDFEPFGGTMTFDTERGLILVAAAAKGLGYLDTSDLAAMEYIIIYTYDDGVVPDYLDYDSDTKILIGSGGESYHLDEMYKIDLTDLANPILGQIDVDNTPRHPVMDKLRKVVYIPLSDPDNGIVAIDYSGAAAIVASLTTTMESYESALSSSQ